MKRKMAMVLLTLVTAVSLVFGMTTISAQAATELVLGEVSTENTKNTAIEIGCEQFTNGGEDVDLTVNGKEYVTLTTNGTTYNASHIRQVYSRKTFRVYFLGSGYNFSSAKKGDLFTVKAGFAISNYDLTVSEDINYIFTGSSWIKGSELPTEAEAFVLGDVSLARNTEIEISNTQLGTGGDDKDLTVSAFTDISMTAADGEVYTPSHIRQIVSRKTFKLFFNNANGNGKKYSFNSATAGDLLTIKKGFAIKGDYNLEAKADINYIYTGTAWIAGNELPAEKGEMTVTKFGTTSSYGKTDALLYINTDSENTTDFGDADKSYPRGFVTFTFADGAVGDVWYARVCKDEVRLFIHNKNGVGNLNVASLARGDKFVIRKGFAISSDGATEVKADLNYIYTGSAWVEGTELPAEAEELVLGDVSPFFVSGTQIEIGCTVFTGGDEKDLTVENADKIVLTDTTGKTYASSHRRQITSRKAFKLYFNGTGYSFDSAKRGDKLVIGAGFAIKGDYNYVVKSDITYLYTGTCWVKATELPAEKTELKVNSITAGVGVSGENKGDALVYVNTDSSSDVNNGNADVAELRNFVRYTFAGESVAYGNVWYARLNKAEARFFVRQKNNAASNMAVSDIAKGDKFTVKKGFSIGNAEVKADVTYIYNGNVWVDEKDYIDYDALTKNGIAADVTEITLYKGDKFVVPALHYTYEEEVKVPEVVEAEDITVENAPDMNTVNENGYDVTLKVGAFSLNLKVKVLATTDIFVTGVVVDTSWNKIQVVTSTENTVNNTNAQKEYLEYFSYMRNGVELTIDGYVILTKNYGLDISVNGEKLVFGGVSAVKAGDTLTIKKGLPGINGERLAKTVTYVYNGGKFVELIEPETFELAETSATLFVGVTRQIVVKDDEKVTAVYTYVSDHPEIAAVNEYGVITGVKEGTAKITVSYKGVSKEMTVTVKPEPEKTGVEIVSEIPKYYVPVSTTEAPTSFVGMGYTLKARYVYEGGEYGEEFDITEEQIGEIDYTTAGTRDLTVTVGKFKAVVTVEVYNYKEITSFNTLGVSGYDINDDRNATGTWNGHMIISTSNVSTSVGNLLSTDSCEKMSEYIVYTTADGKTYYGKADKDNEIEDRIGLWQLGTNLLVMIKPEGATANIGYGMEDHWKADAQHPYVPIYKLGDKITFKKGMPLYAWKGSVEGSKPVEGAGCLIVEGYVKEDLVYFCYEENGTSSLWMIYKEYTDFTVATEKTMALGTASPAGAVKVPADATTGTFTYVSSNPDIVSVTKDGNMLAEKVGTATITVTLTGGKDADGNDLDPIVKTINVTVKNGIKSVSGKITVEKGSAVKLGDYEITVKYSDGTEVKVKLDDERVVIEDIDTSVVGTTTANVLFNDGNEQKRGTVTVEVVEKTEPAPSDSSSGSGSKGCFGSIGGLGVLGGLTAIAAAVVITKKKRDN